MSNSVEEWRSGPAQAYAWWQATEAAGADGRPFAPRSIVQHQAMFERFLRFLREHDATLMGFGTDTLEAFFVELGRDCTPGTSTDVRYFKLIDRVGRHLVAIGARHDNPAALARGFPWWPNDELLPLFMDSAADERLQAYLQPSKDHTRADIKKRAAVAMLSATGISSVEFCALRLADLVSGEARPHLVVAAHGAREERKVMIAPFALPILSRYLAQRAHAAATDYLFVAKNTSAPLNDRTLGRIVREILSGAGYLAPDMSPRILRNTYCRRQLLAGRSNEDVSRLLGLESHRTVVRMRQTLTPDREAANRASSEHSGGEGSNTAR